jgi:hypothetical protein
LPHDRAVRSPRVAPLFLALALLGCKSKPLSTSSAPLLKRWSALHLPQDGLQALQPQTNEHGYYADYAGADEAALWAKVSAAMTAEGYAPACHLFDGHVRGFAKGDDKLVAKIDTLGVLALSIFDEQGKDALLHGVCFGKYQLGPATTVR